MLKPILLYTKHRQTIPIIEENGKDFILIDFDRLWKYLRIFGKTNTSKLRAKVYWILLKILRPAIILDINWIGRVAMIHHIYSKNNKVNLLVVQHGFYTGGYISARFPENRLHKMARCTHFWIWSDCIRKEVTENHAKILVKGNPIYNKYFRLRLSYKKLDKIQSVLILPTAFEMEDDSKIDKLNSLIRELKQKGYSVSIKLHNQNIIRPDTSGAILLENFDIYKVLLNHEYDLIIADHSTTLLDAIYLNNLVAFCNFHEAPNTLYEKFLGELNKSNIDFEFKEIISLNRVKQQEQFINYLGLNNSYSNSLLDISKNG